jgi:ribonuclease HI
MSEKNIVIDIYTDGSCIEKRGGWAIIVLFSDKIGITLSGCEKNTTNNRMELKAVIEALKFILENGFINTITTIHSDSMLTINCAEGKWKRNKNMDLWKEYDFLFHSIKSKAKIVFKWVKAHNGIEHNEFVDKESRAQTSTLNTIKI